LKKLTQELILDVTEQLIYEKGMNKTTLNDIAHHLGVSHPALYKHFLNKEELFQTLALRWLEETSRTLFDWEPNSFSIKDNLHDWLWLFVTSKKNLFENDQKMFILYTDYIENNDKLIESHLHKLAKKVSEISGLNMEMGSAIITTFTYFHNPYFAQRWHKTTYQKNFENVYQLICMQLD
jgi:AcrR family transcriptional regulator